MAAAGKPETLLRGIPGAQEFEDDLRDQWECDAHKAERQQLLSRLFQTAQKAKCRVTILSGDIHVGAQAKITSGNGDVINQLVTSGMVHPAPGWIAQLAVSLAGSLQGVSSFGGGMQGHLVQIDGATFLTKENYLQLRFDEPEAGNPQTQLGRMHAMWVTQSGPMHNARVTVSP